MKEKIFFAHVASGQLIPFTIPANKLKEIVKCDKSNNDQSYKETQAAGWWFINKIDTMSCIGPYEYCILSEKIVIDGLINYTSLLRRQKCLQEQ